MEGKEGDNRDAFEEGKGYDGDVEPPIAAVVHVESQTG